jgi:hypothetical protein
MTTSLTQLAELVDHGEFRTLLQRGQEVGFLSIEDVAEMLDALGVDAGLAEDIYQQLDEAGIELLEPTEAASRMADIAWLKDQTSSFLRWKTPGGFGSAPLWGTEYDQLLSRTKMGINSNRQEGYFWYSSARIAQMGGNGILCLTHDSGALQSLYPEETLVYFSQREELAKQLRAFHEDDAMRRHYASRTHDVMHREFSSRLNAQYILETALGLPLSHDYLWLKKL